MSDEILPPPFVYDGLDPALAEKSVIGEVADAVKGTAQRIGEAVDSGRKPGMPLSVLSNIAREAPLGSLLIALLLWVSPSQGEDSSRGQGGFDRALYPSDLGIELWNAVILGANGD